MGARSTHRQYLGASFQRLIGALVGVAKTQMGDVMEDEKVQVTVRIPAESHRALKVKCASRDVSIQYLIECWVEKYLAENDF